MAVFVGMDASTQSLSAMAIEIEGGSRRVVFDDSLPYDLTFPRYQTKAGVIRGADAREVTAPPLMWADALDLMMQKLAAAIDVKRVAAISGSAQQHGSVYMNDGAAPVLDRLDRSTPLVEQLTGTLSRPVAPVWMDASTRVECGEIEEGAGGAARLAAHTGSRAFARFTGPQIRKFFKRDRARFDETSRIHLVSSFHASLLIGGHAPIDAADASGMNLMDLAGRSWWRPAVEATAPGLISKLPAIVPSSAVIGTLAAYWQERFGFPAARVIAWSGDNPCSAIGTGLVSEHVATISLGTSDTVFGLMREPRVDPGGTGHVFCDPTGAYMGLTCFQNGALARKRVRDLFGITWETFSLVLEETAPGNDGGLLLPWFDAEITPPVLAPGAHRRGIPEDDAERNIRGVVEGQAMAMCRHSRWMGAPVDRIHATGGGARSRAVLQVIADVFGADVHQLTVGNSAALGAALRAVHGDAVAAGRELPWAEVIDGFVGSRATIRPRPSARAIYEARLAEYERFEAECLTTLPAFGDEASRSPAS